MSIPHALLALLNDGPKYGLEISKEAQDRTNGYFDFKVGSLYPALHRLEGAGWLQGEFQPAPRGGAPVKFYQLTESGERALADKRAQFREFARQVEALWRPA